MMKLFQVFLRGLVLFLLLDFSSCATTAHHYRIPQDKTASFGVNLRILAKQGGILGLFSTHFKVRLGASDELFFDWTPGAFLFGDSSDNKDTWAVEPGWIHYFQPGAKGGDFVLSLPVIRFDGQGPYPDFKFLLNAISQDNNLLLFGGIYTSVARIIGTGMRTGGMYGAPEGGSAGIFPLGLDLGIGGYGEKGGGIVSLQLETMPSFGLEFFLTP